MSETLHAYICGFLNGASIVLSLCAWWSAREIKHTEAKERK